MFIASVSPSVILFLKVQSQAYRILFHNYKTYLCIISDCKTGDLLTVAMKVSLTTSMKVLHHHHTAT